MRKPAARKYWWNGDRRERFWIRTTGPDGLGKELRSPQTDKPPPKHWAHILIREVRRGDVIFHLYGKAIIGWSLAVRNARPEPGRSGWFADLEDSHRSGRPVALAELAANDDVRAVHAELKASHPGLALYSPFTFPARRAPYVAGIDMAKLPAGLVYRVPDLSAAAQQAATSHRARRLAWAASRLIFGNYSAPCLRAVNELTVRGLVG